MMIPLKGGKFVAIEAVLFAEPITEGMAVFYRHPMTGDAEIGTFEGTSDRFRAWASRET